MPKYQKVGEFGLITISTPLIKYQIFVHLCQFHCFQQIVGYPSTKVLTSEEKDLVWQFRFYLTNQKKVLILMKQSDNLVHVTKQLSNSQNYIAGPYISLTIIIIFMQRQLLFLNKNVKKKKMNLT